MTGYWDAVTRAALGHSGSAAPRPRSPFEQEARQMGGEPDFDEDTIAEPPTSDAAMNAPVALTDRSASALMIPQDHGYESPSVVREPPSQATVAQHGVHGSPGADSDAPQIVASPAHREPDERLVRTDRVIEHVEVHRFETTHVAAAESRRASDVPVPSTPLRAEAISSPAAPIQVEHRQSAAPAETMEPQAPVVVIAEPIAEIAEHPTRSSDAREIAPLIIEIDRIDIRVESERSAEPVVSRRNDPSLVPSLDDYLRKRSEARR